MDTGGVLDGEFNFVCKNIKSKFVVGQEFVLNNIKMRICGIGKRNIVITPVEEGSFEKIGEKRTILPDE